MTYLIVVTSAHGKKVGLSMVAGILLGLLVVGVVALSGAEAIFLQSPILFKSIGWAGVVYMLWLAWESWKEKPKKQKSDATIKFFRRGFVTNVLNAKAFIFYLTFFPPFMDMGKPMLPQAAFLVSIYLVIATSIHALLVLLAERAQPFFSNQVAEKKLRRFFAFLMVGIAAWLAWSIQTSSLPE